MRFVYALTLTLAAAAIALCAPPELKLTPSVVKPAVGDLVVIAAETTALNVKWKVVGDWQTVKDSGGRSILVVCKSTRVDIIAVASNDKGELSEFVVCTFDGSKGAPAPGPTPAPVTPSKLFVVIVEETSEAVGARGAMFSDAELAARMKAKGHAWRVVDKDVVGPDGKPPADVARFLKASAGKGLPQIFLVDADGVGRYAGDWGTKTAADLLALLTQWGG